MEYQTPFSEKNRKKDNQCCPLLRARRQNAYLAMKGFSQLHSTYSKQTMINEVSQVSGPKVSLLTLKAEIAVAADDTLKYSIFIFHRKIMLGISCNASTWNVIHMKCQALFSTQTHQKKECCLLKFCLVFYGLNPICFSTLLKVLFVFITTVFSLYHSLG